MLSIDPLLTSGLFLLLGSVTGVLSGVFGVGGGILLVPLLTLWGLSLHQAIGMSLVYVLLTGLSGTISHARQGHLHWSLAFWLALGAMLSVYGGTRLGQWLSSAWLAWFFSALIGGIMVLFWQKLHGAYETESKTLLPSPMLASFLIGALAGLLSGLFGVGGGIVMTPLLVIFSPLTLQESISTSLGAVVLIAFLGTLSHLVFGQLWTALQTIGFDGVLLVLAGVTTAPVGARLTQTLPETWLQQGLFVLLALVGGYMLYYGWVA